MCCFGRSIGTNTRKFNKLMTSTFFDWSTALRDLNHHQCHHGVLIPSLLAIQIFVSVFENESNAIIPTQDLLYENKVSMNSEKRSIIKYILLCGRHSLLLKGHK